MLLYMLKIVMDGILGVLISRTWQSRSVDRSSLGITWSEWFRVKTKTNVLGLWLFVGGEMMALKDGCVIVVVKSQESHSSWTSIKSAVLTAASSKLCMTFVDFAQLCWMILIFDCCPIPSFIGSLVQGYFLESLSVVFL